MAKPNLQNYRGFTLIELLVVIAVISLLASVVLVALNSSRVKAKIARAAADLRQIRTMFELYLNANGSYPCFDHLWDDSYDRTTMAPYGSWPKNPWGTEYAFDHNQYTGGIFSISLRTDSLPTSQMLDQVMDDGNLSTGVLRENLLAEPNRLEYGLDENVPFTHCHFP